MAENDEKPKESTEKEPESTRKKRRSWWRILGMTAGFILLLLVCARLALPRFVLWYVNRTLNESPMYQGEIGDVSIHLYRGAYSIHEVRILKTTGNVPVPFFAAKRVDLAIEWDALMHRKVVGKIVMHEPELNFVDAPDDSSGQSGAGGPWLQMIDDLFPFRINSTQIRNGSIHFRAFQANPPVDVYLSQLDASIENLTNIKDEITPMIATVSASALAMDQARFEYEMKLDPSSYRPSFQLAVRLIGLDVTKTNALARAYGKFDFESGWFDLVVELDAKEGQLEGYVKPLFRNLKIFSMREDLARDNPLQAFWEALVGTATEVLKNQPRQQFGTVIPLTGDLNGPRTDVLATLGNVLRNAFVRAYLPRLQGVTPDIDGLHFGRGSILEPVAADGSR